MSERPYLNFDLQIEKSDAGYHVRVLDSPAGQAASEATLPFSDLEMENFLLKLGQKTRGTRRLESNQLEGIREFGAKLFQSMISGEVGGAYRSSVTLADRDGAGLRIRLRLSAAPDLIHIPWEFLFDPVARRFVALSVDSPIVRFLDIPGPTRPFVVEPPIKVLVIISSPSDFAPLQVENEWSRLKDAVRDIEGRGLIALERLETPTLTELQRALRRTYHVLHFIGHGGFDDQGQDGVLVFEDERGRGAEVSATYLSTLLHDADSLRLAVLNACDGAVSSRVDQFAGVAQSLLQQGVPAVVAMQFEITDDAAITFAHEFYGAFADGYSVEASLAEARKSIFAGQNDFEWATPVVYLRSVDGPIFKISPVATPPVPPAPVPEPVPDEPEPETIPITGGPPGGQGGGDDGGGGGKSPPWWRRFGLSRSRTAVGLGGLGLAVVVAAVALIALRGGGGGAAGGTPEATPTPYQTDFTGTWWTNSARVELNDSNGLVTGTYYTYLGDNQPHQLAGASNGRELSGSFDGPNNYFYFERTDENTLKGYWRDPKTGAEHQWCGRRGEQFLQADCGYSGDWRVKGLPAALELRTDVVQFSQTAGAAVLQFESRRYGVIQVAGKFDSATLAKVSGSTAAIQSNTRVPVYNVEWQLGEPDAKWDTIKGTWQAVSPATGSGEWCAWRPDASPPC